MLRTASPGPGYTPAATDRRRCPEAPDLYTLRIGVRGEERKVALSIRDPETDRLARELAALTGETMTQAIRGALAERLAREKRRRELLAIIEEFQKLPVLDDRSEDEILGYDEHGLPR